MIHKPQHLNHLVGTSNLLIIGFNYLKTLMMKIVSYKEKPITLFKTTPISPLPKNLMIIKKISAKYKGSKWEKVQLQAEFQVTPYQ